MPRAKRREREIQRTREDILEAAARVFARAGYKSATMQQIATEAGYTAPSLYSYFTGKEAILLGLVEMITKFVMQTFEEPLPKGSTLEQSLELFLHRQLSLCERHKDALQVMFNFMSFEEHPPELDPKPEHDREFIVDRLATWLEKAAGEGELGRHTPQETAEFLFSIIFFKFQRWLRLGDGKLTDMTPQVLDLFLHGVCGCDKGAGSDD